MGVVPLTGLLGALAEIDRGILASEPDLGALLAAVARAAVTLLDGRIAHVWIADDERRTLLVEARAARDGVPPGLECESLPFGEGVVGAVHATGADEHVHDAGAGLPWRQPGLAREAGVQGCALAPVEAAGRVVGVLGVLLGPRLPLDAGERQCLRLLAARAGLGLLTVERLRDERARRDRLARLLELNRRLGALDSPDALPGAIAGEAIRLLGALGAEVRLAGQTGPPATAGERSAAATVLDLSLDVGGRHVGDLSLSASRPFTARDVELAQAVAGQAAVALAQASLRREAALQAERMAALAEVERLLVETLDPANVASRIVDSLCRLLGVPEAVLHRLRADSGDLDVVAASWAPGAAPVRTFLPPGTGVAGLTVREGRPVASPDVLADPRVTLPADVRARVEASGNRARLAVPLAVRGRIIGTITAGDRAGRLFGADDVALARAFADQAAVALENARLHDESERDRREAEAVQRMAAALTQEPGVASVAERVTSSIVALLGVAASSLRLLDPDGSLRAVAYGGLARHLAPGDVRPPGLGGATGRAVAEGRAVQLADLPADWTAVSPAMRALIQREGLRSVLALPLRSKGRSIGALVVSDTVSRRYSPHEIALAQTFADQAAVALENARLHDEADRRRREAEVVAEVARTVNASLDLGTVLDRVAEAARELCDGDAARLALPVAGTARLAFRHVAGARGDDETTEVEPGHGTAGRALATGAPVRSEDPRQPAELAVPIRSGDRMDGVLHVSRSPGRPFSERDETVLARLADHAAVAIRNASLYADARRRLEETRALLEVAELLNSTLDSRKLMRRLAIKIAQVCGVDRCSVLLFDGERTVALMSQFADGHRDEALWAAFLALRPRAPAELPAHARVLETRRPLLIPDPRTSALLPPDWAPVFGLGAVMAVPLVRQDVVIGVMYLDYGQPHRAFAPWQVDRALAIAGQVALSLENARLYGEVRDSLRETSTLLAVGRALALPEPLAQRLRLVAREVGRAVGAGTAGVYALDAPRAALVPVAGHHVPGPLLDLLRARPLVLDDMPEVARAWAAGRTVSSADLATDPRVEPAMLAGLPPGTLLLVPTRLHGDSVGAIALVRWAPGRPFAPDEVRLVEGVAVQLGLALEHAELERQTEDRLRRSEALRSVSQELAGARDVETVFRPVLRHVARVVDADGAGIWVPAAEGERLVLGSVCGGAEARAVALRGVPVAVAGDAALAEAVRTRRAVLVSDLDADPRATPAWREAAAAASEVLVPVVARDRLLGVIRAFWSAPRARLGAEEATLLEAIAGQAAVALENAGLFESNTRQLAELSVLYELSRAVTGQFDRRALVESMAAQIGRIADARNLTILVADDRRRDLEVVYRTHRGERDRDPASLLGWPGVGLVSVVLRTATVLRTDDYLAACARHGVEPAPGAALLPYWLGVPMVAGRRALGVLALASAERPFTESDQRLLTNVAHLAALALRSARLFDELAAAYADLATAQDQLVRTERLRALGEMASGVAHDFNNLLAAILGRAQLLLRRTEDVRLQRGLQIIERAAQDGAQTVRRLQEFARERRDEPRVAVDLAQIAREALTLTQAHWGDEAQRRGAAPEIRTELAPVPPVTGNPAELREAVMNLLLNAIDAMPEGGTLTVATAASEDGVEVRVTDTGAGIPVEVRDRIFDPFFTTKGPRGTGLGLSLTYGIASRHGGRVTVESEAARGSTFGIVLPPRRPEPAARPEGAAGAAPAVAPRTAPAAPLRCLVVDDEPEVATLIGECLEADGHRVAVLYDGREAIERLGVEAFDLVITDLAMTGASGWDVAAAAGAARPAPEVLLVSGFGVELSPDELRRQGIAEVLAKPIRIEQLTAAVARVADARQHAGGETA